MSLICKFCNKEYKSYSARSVHYNLKHQEQHTKNKQDKKNNCELCNKHFTSRQSKYYHKKKCENRDDSLLDKNQELINKLEKENNNNVSL